MIGCFCRVFECSVVCVMFSTTYAIAEDDALDAFMKNARELRSYCCLMEVDLVENLPDVNNSKFFNQTFTCVCDDENRRRRFDHFPEFDSGNADKIPIAGNSFFVLEDEKKLFLYNRSPKMVTFSFEEVKKSEMKVFYCAPFSSTMIGYPSFTGRSISGLADDDLAKLFKRFVVQKREDAAAVEIVDYRVSSQAPVFCTVLHDKEIGGMPKATEIVLRGPGSEPRELGKSRLEWKKLGDAWVPVLQRSETISAGGPASAGGYNMVCTVKYRWSLSTPETVWKFGDEFLYPDDLKAYILEHEHIFK